LRKFHFKTIVLSDVHLGTSGSKAREVVDFLKIHSCDTLILNGDIIDGWQLKKYGNWKKKHTRFLRAVMKMMETHKTRVVYIRGNHDDFLDQIIPLQIGKRFSIQRELIYESCGRRYLVTHGDVFDSITTQMRWIAQLGDAGYTFLLWLNKIYNLWRVKRGLPYYSLSQKIKAKVKGAVAYISDYEQELIDLAASRGCTGVICGHIHQPAIREENGFMYLNSGDWVESLSALLEDYEGRWKLHFHEHNPLSDQDDEDMDIAEDFSDVLTTLQEDKIRAGSGDRVRTDG
jgi:UDP-2,3-diacylglucosamine pyrophosphatase LpxH